MRNLRLLDVYRRAGHPGGLGDDTCGVFELPSPIDKASLRIIASSGEGWDHVSVSRANRCPNYPEMEYVRRMFFRDDETVMQLHVPRGEHVNVHPYCLHLWRPQTADIPRPPAWMIA